MQAVPLAFGHGEYDRDPCVCMIALGQAMPCATCVSPCKFLCRRFTCKHMIVSSCAHMPTLHLHCKCMAHKQRLAQLQQQQLQAASVLAYAFTGPRLVLKIRQAWSCKPVNQLHSIELPLPSSLRVSTKAVWSPLRCWEQTREGRLNLC